MLETLYQRNIFFHKKWFEINDEGLSIISRSLSSNTELFVKFEDIGVKIIKDKKGKKGWIIASIICFLLAVGLFFDEKTGGNTDKNAFVVYLIFSIIFVVVFFMTYERSFYLADNDSKNAIKFLIDKPSKQELNDFIDKLKIERKKVLLTKYGQLTNLLSYERQLNSLNWLDSIEALSNKEYEDKISQLNFIFQKSNPIIGFKSSEE